MVDTFDGNPEAQSAPAASPENSKQAVIEACCEPGASVAGIAMANGVNANQVRRWMRERGMNRRRGA